MWAVTTVRWNTKNTFLFNRKESGLRRTEIRHPVHAGDGSPAGSTPATGTRAQSSNTAGQELIILEGLRDVLTAGKTAGIRQRTALRTGGMDSL